MSYLAPRPDQGDEQLQRLLRERLAGDSEAVRKVQALIRDLRAPADRWEASPPAHCELGRVPHC